MLFNTTNQPTKTVKQKIMVKSHLKIKPTKTIKNAQQESHYMNLETLFQKNSRKSS